MDEARREFKHPSGFDPKSPDYLRLTLTTQPLVYVSLQKKYHTSFPPSKVAVLFDSNLSRRPFLGQVACRLRPIELQTLVSIDSKSRLTSFPSFCAPIFGVAVLFDSNLSRRPFFRQVVDLDLLLCTGFDSEYAVFFSCVIFLLRPMNERKIERSDGCCFGRQQLLDNSNYSIENFT